MTDSPASASSCLRSTQGHPVPLLGVSIGGEVFGAQAHLVVRQRYRNDEARPIEAIYTFPLPSDAVLTGFAMECAGRRLVGEVKEREEAFRTYDEAITRGHGAALLDQERRNVFTANVGNLLPGEETVVEVTYVQRLAADEGALRLMIPTLVAPRYIPGTQSGDRSGHGAADPTDRVPDADRISPKIGAVSYGLSLDVTFDLGREVTVESPSHAITVADAGQHRRRVSLRSPTVPLDRDLVLTAAGAPGVAAGVVAERTSGEGTFALTVVPDLFDPARRAAARDVVFVVDVSGSMGGASIEQARSALRLCLRHLAEGDRFNVIAFSTTFSSFQPALAPMSQRTLEAADRWVAALDANGGTEMLAPLLAAAAAFDDRGRARVIVLLTDGQVGNEAEIVEQVAAKAAGARVYTFGIGTNVSDLLVGDLARRTRGASELIHPGERIDDKVTAQFARAIAARVEEVTIKFAGVDPEEITPAELMPLVDGEPWVLYGRYAQPGIGHAEIRGVLRGERFYLEVPLDLPAEASRAGLAALWAAARIRDLTDGERSLSGRRAEASKKRIVDLSVTHGVASKYASFVVVERREADRRTAGQPEARPVPVSAPAGWAMFARPDLDLGIDGGAKAKRGRMPSPMKPASFGMRSAPPMPPPMIGSPQPAGSYAAPPPPCSPGPMARPAASAAPSPPPPPMRAMSLLDDEDRTLVGSLAHEDSFASPAPAAPGPMGEGSLRRASSPPGAADRALFERQLASGLWDGAGATDADRLMATARALAACFAAGIDTSHATYGAQVRKAVEAVCRLAAELARRGEAEREVMAALAAAFLVASGPRLRRDVIAVVEGGPSAVKSLAAHLTSQGAAKSKLAELGLVGLA